MLRGCVQLSMMGQPIPRHRQSSLALVSGNGSTPQDLTPPLPILQIAYVTVAGKYLKGAGLREKGATWGQKVVGAGYAQVTIVLELSNSNTEELKL